MVILPMILLRCGVGVMCKHGDFFTCSDRYNPGVLQTHKWENAMTIDKQSWGYRRNMNIADVFTIQELIKELAVTVSCGGNLLMNVGPNSDGVIVPIFEVPVQLLMCIMTLFLILGETETDGSVVINQWRSNLQDQTLVFPTKHLIIIITNLFNQGSIRMIQSTAMSGSPAQCQRRLGLWSMPYCCRGQRMVRWHWRVPYLDQAPRSPCWGWRRVEHWSTR